MTTTIGAAVGALIFVLFMSHIATSLATPASGPVPAQQHVTNR